MLNVRRFWYYSMASGLISVWPSFPSSPRSPARLSQFSHGQSFSSFIAFSLLCKAVLRGTFDLPKQYQIDLFSGSPRCCHVSGHHAQDVFLYFSYFSFKFVTNNERKCFICIDMYFVRLTRLLSLVINYNIVAEVV